jgi:hypothetical protein
MSATIATNATASKSDMSHMVRASLHKPIYESNDSACESLPAVGDNVTCGRLSTALVKAGATALVVQNDPFFDSRRSQIVALSSRHRLPGIFHIREFPVDGVPQLILIAADELIQ